MLHTDFTVLCTDISKLSKDLTVFLAHHQLKYIMAQIYSNTVWIYVQD